MLTVAAAAAVVVALVTGGGVSDWSGVVVGLDALVVADLSWALVVPVWSGGSIAVVGVSVEVSVTREYVTTHNLNNNAHGT